MISLSTNLTARFTDSLTLNSVSQSQHRFSIKWLRYYLDFCTKYSFEWSENESLSAFLIKLKNKNQQQSMQDQAKKAVLLFWKMEKAPIAAPEQTKVTSKNLPKSTEDHAPEESQSVSNLPASSTPSLNIERPAQPVEVPGAPAKQSGADWRHVYAELEAPSRCGITRPRPCGHMPSPHDSFRPLSKARIQV